MPTRPGKCAQVLGHGDGGLGVWSALHIDADEGVGGGGVGDHLADDALGQFGVEVHAHLGELDADVGVELARGDRVEQAMIDLGGGAASASVVTLSPSESRVTAMPSRLTRSQAASASSTVMPATNRPDNLCPIAERSEKADFYFSNTYPIVVAATDSSYC